MVDILSLSFVKIEKKIVFFILFFQSVPESLGDFYFVFKLIKLYLNEVLIKLL